VSAGDLTMRLAEFKADVIEAVLRKHWPGPVPTHGEIVAHFMRGGSMDAVYSALTDSTRPRDAVGPSRSAFSHGLSGLWRLLTRLFSRRGV